MICRSKKPLLWVVFVTIISAWLFPARLANAQINYTVYSGHFAGSYHPVGIALETLMTLKRRQHHQMTLTIKQSSGPVENLLALLKGDADIAFVDAPTLLDALNQSPPFHQYDNTRNFRLLASLWPSTAHLVVRDTLTKTGNMVDVKQLSGQAFSTGLPHSASYMASQNLFKQNGISPGNLFSLPKIDIRDTVDAFSAHVIDGYSLFTHIGDTNIQYTFHKPENEARLLSVSPKQLALLNNSQTPVWSSVIIPAKTYPNQNNTIESVKTANYLITLDTLPQKHAYHLTRTIYDNLTFLSALHPAAQHIPTTIMAEGQLTPIHEGSKRYFQEKDECRWFVCFFSGAEK